MPEEESSWKRKASIAFATGLAGGLATLCVWIVGAANRADNAAIRLDQTMTAMKESQKQDRELLHIMITGEAQSLTAKIETTWKPLATHETRIKRLESQAEVNRKLIEILLPVLVDRKVTIANEEESFTQKFERLKGVWEGTPSIVVPEFDDKPIEPREYMNQQQEQYQLEKYQEESK